MKNGDPEGDATAPEVFLVNLSLGDANRPFAGPMSPWGRLLDYLADRFGILFLVSAGTHLMTTIRDRTSRPQWASDIAGSSSPTSSCQEVGSSMR